MTRPGDQPVFAYIADLPQPQRAIAERINALAAVCAPRRYSAIFEGYPAPTR